jgi:hypothetical protein
MSRIHGLYYDFHTFNKLLLGGRPFFETTLIQQPSVTTIRHACFFIATRLFSEIIIIQFKIKSWIRNETENRNQERRRPGRKNDEELMKDVMRRSRNNYASDLSHVETRVPYATLTSRVKRMN